MARAELSVFIDRPPDQVFAFVAEPANNPRWRSYVIESGWLDGLIEYRIEADGSGSRISRDRHRSFRPTRQGRLAGSYMLVFGPWILRRQFAAGLRRVSR